MSKKNQRKGKALEEIQKLKAKRRLDIIKCAASLLVIVLLIFGQAWLQFAGIIAADNMVVHAILMFAAIGLAILAGSASVDFSKSGRLIEMTRSQAGLSKEDIKAYERGE